MCSNALHARAYWRGCSIHTDHSPHGTIPRLGGSCSVSPNDRYADWPKPQPSMWPSKDCSARPCLCCPSGASRCTTHPAAGCECNETCHRSRCGLDTAAPRASCCVCRRHTFDATSSCPAAQEENWCRHNRVCPNPRRRQQEASAKYPHTAPTHPCAAPPVCAPANAPPEQCAGPCSSWSICSLETVILARR